MRGLELPVNLELGDLVRSQELLIEELEDFHYFMPKTASARFLRLLTPGKTIIDNSEWK